MEGKHISLHGNEQSWIRIWKLTENGLAADYDNICLVGNDTGGADNMFKLDSLHIL